MSTPPSNSARLLQQAMQHASAGQWSAAEALCRQVLAKHPAQPTALHVLGVCLLQQGRFGDAEQALAACLQAQPNEPAALGNRGIALQALGRFDEALACYAESLARAPDQPATLNMQGLALMELKRFDEALQSFDRATAVAPKFAEAWCSRANALIHLRQYDLALASLDRAEALRPNYGEALSNRSIVLNQLGRHDEALAAAEQTLALLGGRAIVHRNLADALAGLQRFEEALQIYDRLVDANPADFDLKMERAATLRELHRYDESLAELDAILVARQDDFAAMNARGLALQGLGRYEEALESLMLAEQMKPDFHGAHTNEAWLRLLLGDFENGWRKYEWRKANPLHPLASRRFRQPLWTGKEDVRGATVFLYAEQGLGDAIQFARFVPLVTERGARVVLGVHPPLKSLLETVEGVSNVVGDGEPLPSFDWHVPLMSLPFALGVRLESLPAHVPYLFPDARLSEAWVRRLGVRSRPRIGLAWCGSPTLRHDRHRSIRFPLLCPLLDVDAEFICLTNVVREGDREAMDRFGVRFFGHEQTDFAETAALATQMDLVISVDTSIAHLAGALGLPLWLLIPDPPEWRWLLERDDSPWYPTARLFRQTSTGDWNGVIDRVHHALVAFTASLPNAQRA